MRTWREQFAKSFLEDVLGPLGTVEAQHEIAHPEAQWADVWFEPDPHQSDEGLRLGWLGKMSEGACIFESFSNMPSASEVRGCLRKLLTKQHRRMLDAEKRQEEEPSLANLWVLAPSLRSSHALDFGLNAREGWPCGFYFLVPGYGLGWVSLRELPPGRGTLLLRLLSAGGAVFLGALKELKQLPKDAIERQVAKQILIAHKAEIDKNEASDVDEMEVAMSYQEIYQE